MPKPTMKFKKNGRTHVALLMAKSLKKWFTTTDLREMTNIFNDVRLTSQSLNLLKREGFLEKEKNMWRITPKGVSFLYLTATYNPLANVED